MQLRELQIQPPDSAEEFASLCRALFAEHWQDPQSNTRLLQAEPVINVYGKTADGAHWGVRCWGNEKLTQKKIAEIAALATQFQPTLTHCIIATTSAADAKLQQYARQLSEEQAKRGACSVHVYSWESIVDLLDQYPNVARRFYPELFSHSKKPLHLPPQQLSPWFSDPRNDLAALRTLMQSAVDSRVVLRTAVQGMGGVGKTQLALKYSLSFQDDYAGVWWFNSAGSESLLQECLLFCALQGIALPETKDIASVAPAAMRAWLARQQNWLLVFDNAEGDTPLQEYLPQAGAHHVLLTSRHPSWEGMQELALQVWSEDEALPYLQLRLPHQAEADLRALCRALDGLPLALEQACAYILKHQVAVLAYVQRVEDVQKQIALLERNDVPVYGRVVLATLSIAFEKLSDSARALLQLCGWLAPEPIPEFLFTEHREDLPPALQSLDDFTWRETMAELESHALCKLENVRLTDHVGNGTEWAQCLLLHRLTQMAVRARLEGHDEFVLKVLRMNFPLDADEPQRWPRCRTLQPHIQILHLLTEKKNSHALCWLIGQLASWMYFGPSLYQPALSLQQRCLQMTREIFGDSHSETMVAMNNLAATLGRMGDFVAARNLEEKTLEINRAILGDEHRNTLISMSNLALTIRHQGDLATASSMQKNVLQIRSRLFGEEHPDTLSSMNNLAQTMVQMGELTEAKALHEKALFFCQRVLGECHPNTLTVMNNLANTFKHLGHLDDARKLLEKEMEISKRIMGEEHPATLASMNNLATILSQTGELVRAGELQEQTLALFRRLLGEAHPSSLTAMGNLALTQKKLGNLHAACQLQEEEFAICSKVLSEEHPETQISMGNLAVTRREMGDLDTARELEERVLQIRRQFLGEEHPHTLIAMNNLALTLIQMGEFLAACDLQQKELEVCLRVLGQDHPDTIASKFNLATNLYQLGELPIAQELFKQAFGEWKKILGETHPNTVIAQKYLLAISQGDTKISSR